MCKHGLMVDPVNIVVIINLEPSTSVKKLFTMLRHKDYYRNFIKAYTHITTPMEKLLKKDVKFYWDDDYQETVDILKEKIVIVPILVFPD